MKYRFIFTSFGWLIGLVAISLLVGAAILDTHSLGGIWSNMMIAIGLILVFFGYIRTYRNIKKHNRDIEKAEKEAERQADEEAERQAMNEYRRSRKG